MNAAGAPARPRVLHVVDSLHTGGLERLLELMIEHGHDTFDHRVCAIRALGDIGERLRSAGTQVDVLGRSENADRTVIPRLARYIAKQRPDIVHAHSEGAADAPIAARLAGVGAAVFTEHGWQQVRTSTFQRWKRGAMLRPARRVIAVSDYFARTLRRDLWVPEAKLRIVRNAVPELARPDEGERSRQRARLRIDDASFVVGAVGALRPVKRFSLLVEALERMTRQRPEVTLLLVGDGPDRPNIEAAIARLGLGAAVRLTGHQQSVRDHLAAMDLFAVSSDIEGTSLALLEACWCALPAVATEVGGNPEVVDAGVTGLLVEPGDAAAMADAIEIYAADRARARADGARARDRVRRLYPFAAFLEAHHALYRELAVR